MGGGAACLYSRVEEEGAKRLTMQRSSPSLTTLSSLYPFNPLPASGGSTKATSWWYSLFNIVIVLWWKDFGRYKKQPMGAHAEWKSYPQSTVPLEEQKGVQLHVACRERRRSFFFVTASLQTRSWTWPAWLHTDALSHAVRIDLCGHMCAGSAGMEEGHTTCALEWRGPELRRGTEAIWFRLVEDVLIPCWQDTAELT